MECKQTGENLSAYLDGELEPEEEKVLKSHLEGCEPCRTELERLRSTVRLVRSLPRAQAPAALKQRLMAAAGARRPGYRLPFALTALTAAALLLVSIVAAYMLIPREPIAPDATTAVRTEPARPDAGKTSAPLAKAVAEEAVPHAREREPRKSKGWVEKAEEVREFEFEEDDKEIPTLARRWGKRGKEAEETAPAPPGQLAPEPYNDTRAKLERKLEKHAEFDAAKTEIRDEPARAPAEPRLKKARGKRAPEPAVEYLLETPNVARTAALVRKLIARYAVVQKPDEAPSTGADLVQGKEMVGGESVVLLAEVDSREYPALIARLDALRVQTVLEDMELSKAAEQEVAKLPAEAEPRKERAAKAPAGRAVRRRAPVPENAMAQQRKHKKAGKKRKQEARKEQEELAQRVEQAPRPRQPEEPFAQQQDGAKAAPAGRIVLCIKIRRKEVSAAIEALRAQEAAAKKLRPEKASPKGK